MLVLIALIVLIGFALYYVFNIDFEVGTGFSEMKKQAREVKYRTVDNADEENTRKMLK